MTNISLSKEAYRKLKEKRKEISEELKANVSFSYAVLELFKSPSKKQ
jgi:hypothetical protein